MGNGFRYWASSGNTYSGQFVFGELQGYGVMKYKDGGRYEGEFSRGLREGHGCLVELDGQTYQGSFHDNKKHGEGRMIFRNGDRYEGDWVLDRRQGHGEWCSADGTAYQGQWRDDAFSGQGVLTHRSGITYDGLWIRGFPATPATKIVILGPEVMELIQDSPICLSVQLQTEDGEVAEGESGRVLELWVGIRKARDPADSSTSPLAPIAGEEEKLVQTPFGFECISYPLMDAAPTSPEPRASQGSPIPEGSIEPEFGSDPTHGGEVNAPGPADEKSLVLALESTGPSHRTRQRVDRGSVRFKDVRLAPLPPGHRTLGFGDDPSQKGRRKPAGRLDAEKEEKKTASPEKAGDGRSRVPMEGSPMLPVDQCSPGDYVIGIHDTTWAPFLGQTLPSAFKLLRVLQGKSHGQRVQKDISKAPK
ncbi:MORN repeat-containing protein 1 [Ornithorhynchus anatinus]|uniref:MORN repeat-containing protein 1 n=1 Tax=Ornithorhynchus anatinus TaxID=9258 RepID=UPI0010A83150|nr:MORN repeat-containing protein 1 [Ornithorhynchus anatinus]